MLGDLMIRKLNELRLKNVQCDLELVSSDNISFNIHQIVFTALNQKHFELAVQQAFIYSSDMRILSKKKMYLSHLTSIELELLIEFMYGGTVTKKRKYDILLSALGQLDMMYLLDEVGGFTFDNDSPIKTETDLQTDIQEVSIEASALQDIGSIEPRNETPTLDTINTETVNDCIRSCVESVNLSHTELGSVKTEPETPEPVLQNVEKSSCDPVSNTKPNVPSNEESACDPVSNSEPNAPTNEETDKSRKRLFSVNDSINESLLNDLKEEIASESETAENSFYMDEIEKVYQKVLHRLDDSVMSEGPIGSENEQTFSELDTIGKITSLSAVSTSASVEASSNGIDADKPVSACLWRESSVKDSTCCTGSANLPDSGNIEVVPESSNMSNESVAVRREDVCLLSDRQTTASSQANKTVEILATHAENKSVDSHIQKLPSNLSTVFSVCAPCKTVHSNVLAKTMDSSGIVKYAPTSSSSHCPYNRLDCLSQPANVSTADISNIACSRSSARPLVSLIPNILYGNTSEQQAHSLSTSVLTDKSKQAVTGVLSDCDVTNESISVEANDKSNHVENNKGKKFPKEINYELFEVETDGSGNVVNINEMKNVTEDQHSVGSKVVKDKSKRVITKEHGNGGMDDEPCTENQSTSNLDHGPKLVILEDKCVDKCVNKEPMLAKVDEMVGEPSDKPDGELTGEHSKTVTQPLTSSELFDASKQGETMCNNQNNNETNPYVCIGSATYIPTTTTTLNTLSSTVLKVGSNKYMELRSKSKVNSNKNEKKSSIKRLKGTPPKHTSSIVSDTNVAHTSQSAMSSDCRVVLSDHYKQPIVSQTEIPSCAGSIVNEKKTKIMKELKKSNRKPLFKTSSKKSRKSSELQANTDILNCSSKNDIYSQIKVLDFEKVDGTTPSDLAECKVLTENATAFLKESIQDIDTCSVSHIPLDKSQADEEVSEIGDVGSVDTIKRGKGNLKYQHSKNIETRGDSSRRKSVGFCMFSNKSSDDMKETVKEFCVIDDELEIETRASVSLNEKTQNNKQLNFLSQEETPIKCSSGECIIPVSEVLSLTPAQLVKNYQIKVEKSRKNSCVKDGSPKTSENDSVSAKTRNSDRNQVKISTATSRQNSDLVFADPKAHSVPEVIEQSSEGFMVDLKSANLSAKKSVTVCSNVEPCETISTSVNVTPVQSFGQTISTIMNVTPIQSFAKTVSTNMNMSPMQSFGNHLPRSVVGQPHAILPKVPATLIRFPLRILSHSIQTGKHVIQVEHPTISSTSISPRCSNTLMSNSQAKLPRKRWKSTPDNTSQRKRKSVEETTGLKDVLVDKEANLLDSKKRKLKNSDKTIEKSIIEIDDVDESMAIKDDTETLGEDTQLKRIEEVQEYEVARFSETFVDNNLGSYDNSLSELKIKSSDGSPESNNAVSSENSTQKSRDNVHECEVGLGTVLPIVASAVNVAASSVSSSDNKMIGHVSIKHESEHDAELQVKEEPEEHNRTLDSDIDFEALVEDDLSINLKCENDDLVSSKHPTGNGLKVKLFTNLNKKKKQSDKERSIPSTAASDDVTSNKVSLKPPSLKSCKVNLSELRKQIAARRVRQSRLNHKMVLVNGKQSNWRISRSKFRVNDLVFKSEPLDVNSPDAGIVSLTSNVQVSGYTSTNNAKSAISTCSISHPAVSYILKRPAPTTKTTSVITPLSCATVDSAVSTAMPSSYTVSLIPSSLSMKCSSNNFAPLPIASHSVMPGSSSSSVVLLSSTLQTFSSVSKLSAASVEAITKSPTPVLSSMLSTQPLHQTQTHNGDTIKDSKLKKVRKYKKKIPGEQGKDNVKKKRKRVSKKIESPPCDQPVYVLQPIGTPPQLASNNNSPYRQILPKPPCVAFVMKPAFSQVNE